MTARDEIRAALERTARESGWPGSRSTEDALDAMADAMVEFLLNRALDSRVWESELQRRLSVLTAEQVARAAWPKLTKLSPTVKSALLDNAQRYLDAIRKAVAS